MILSNGSSENSGYELQVVIQSQRSRYPKEICGVLNPLLLEALHVGEVSAILASEHWWQ